MARQPMIGGLGGSTVTDTSNIRNGVEYGRQVYTSPAPAAAPPQAPPAGQQPTPSQTPVAAQPAAPFDPEAMQIQMLKQAVARVNELTQQGRTAEAGALVSMVRDAVANGSDRVKAAFGYASASPTTPTGLGPNYGAGVATTTPGTAQDVLAKAKAAADFVSSQMSKSPDAQALIANLQAQYITQLNALQQQITDQFNKQLGGNDPAVKAMMDQINQTVQVQRQQLLDDMNRRGLLQSGIVLEMQDRLNKNQLNAQEQALAQHYTGILQQLNQALLGFAQQRLDAVKQFGLAGVNAAVTQQQQDLQRTLASLNFGLAAQGQENAAAQAAAQRQLEIANLTGSFNGQPTLAAQQFQAQMGNAEFNRAAQIAQLFGTVPESLAKVLGVPAGTPTSQFLLGQRQLDLRGQGASAQPTEADWKAFQDAAARGDTSQAIYLATTRLHMPLQSALATINTITTQATNSNLASIKAQLGLVSDNGALAFDQLKNLDPATVYKYAASHDLESLLGIKVPVYDQQQIAKYFERLLTPQQQRFFPELPPLPFGPGTYLPVAVPAVP